MDSDFGFVDSSLTLLLSLVGQSQLHCGDDEVEDDEDEAVDDDDVLAQNRWYLPILL